MQITVGADPELFLTDDRNIGISAHGLVPGTKSNPHFVPNGAVQLDGTAAEFNINPARTEEDFDFNVGSVLSTLREMIPSEYKFSERNIQRYSRRYFSEEVPPESQVLGCDPDYNAYTGTVNRNRSGPNSGGPIQTILRTASGHVHVGWTSGQDIDDPLHMDACIRLVRQLDVFLGCPASRNFHDRERKTMYGRAGDFRPKSYGVEYRVLSNFWIYKPHLRRWVFNQTKKAIEELIKGNEINPEGGAWQHYFRHYINHGLPVDVHPHLINIIKPLIPTEHEEDMPNEKKVF